MNWRILILLILFSVAVFGQLPQTFFQQDEWAIFGYHLYWEKAALDWFTRLFIYDQETHLIPLSNLFSYIQFTVFGLNYPWYARTAIIIHISNSLLVFYLAKKITGHDVISFLSAILFLLNSSSHQAITWVATSIGTGLSVTSALVSLLFFHAFATDRYAKIRVLVLSLAALLVSLGFKETSIFFFIFFPLYVLIFGGERKGRLLSRLTGWLLASAIFYGAVRIVISRFWTDTAASVQELSQPGFFVYAYRLVTNPVRLAVQSFVSVPRIISLAKKLTITAYPQFAPEGVADPHITETVVSDIVTFLLALVGVVCFWTILTTYARRDNQRLRKALLLSFGFILTSSIPFIIIPGRAGYITLFDGRHIYMTAVFTSIAVSLTFFLLYDQWKRIRILQVSIIVGITMYIFSGISSIRHDIASQVVVAESRRAILSSLTVRYPKLPDRIVFYIESDRSFYGLPADEAIVPFQSGFGQTLLVWYNALGENFPACFFRKKFLYELLSQDFRECSGRGFGYFRTFEELARGVEQADLMPDQLIGFRYNSKNNSMTDISEYIRAKLFLSSP